MPPTVSSTLPTTLLAGQEQEEIRQPDLSAATGILVSLGLSAVMWFAIGYAVDAMLR